MPSSIEPAAAQDLGKRLKEKREAAGITQSSLASALKISRTAVTQWESSATYPNFERTIELANFLNVTPQWLAFGVLDVEAVDLPLDAAAVPVIRFGKTIAERSIAVTHYLASAFLIEKRLPQTEGLFFFRLEEGDFKEYKMSNYLLIDGNQTHVSGKGDYLIWDGFGPQVVAIMTNLNDPSNVSVHTVSEEQPQLVAVDALTILGRVRGVLA